MGMEWGCQAYFDRYRTPKPTSSSSSRTAEVPVAQRRVLSRSLTSAHTPPPTSSACARAISEKALVVLCTDERRPLLAPVEKAPKP